MKTKPRQQPTQNAIPNGEGFDALPVSFNLTFNPSLHHLLESFVRRDEKGNL